MIRTRQEIQDAADRRGRQEISDATGFDNGERFADDAEVRAYFTAAAQRRMVGIDAVTDQDALDRMAASVIRHRWHMTDEAR